jgi:hypothetical protein
VECWWGVVHHGVVMMTKNESNSLFVIWLPHHTWHVCVPLFLVTAVVGQCHIVMVVVVVTIVLALVSGWW